MVFIRKLYVTVISTLFMCMIGITACREISLPAWQQNTANVPDSIAGDYLSARFAQRRNNSGAAIAYYESALEKDPNNKDMLKKGYELMMQSGEPKQAIVLAERYQKQGGTSPDASLLLALDKVKKQDFAGAEYVLNQVEIKKVEDVGTTSELVIPLLKIWVTAGQGNFAKAQEKLQERGGDGLESFIRYQRAILYDIAGNTKEAEELFDDLAEGAHKSLRLTEVTANFYHRIGDEEKAKKVVERFIEKNTRLDAESFMHSKTPVLQNAVHGASELLLEVASFLYSNRLDEMAQGYTYMSLFLTPDFPHAKLLLSKLLKEKERYKEAVAVLESVTYPPYFSWQARLNIARIHYKLEDYEKAEKLLLTMSNQDPDDRDALLTLGDVLLDRKDYTKAIDIYTKALERAQGSEEKNDWVVYYARGIAYERSEMWEKAEADFFKALEIKPNQPDTLNYLGYTWLIMNKNIDDAKEMLKTAITLRPDDAHIVDSYGWALYKLGDYEISVKYLEKANLLMPHDVTTNDHLGDVYWKLGRTNEAMFQWERALTFEPEEEDKVKIEAKLEYGLEGNPVAAMDQEEEKELESAN